MSGSKKLYAVAILRKEVYLCRPQKSTAVVASPIWIPTLGALSASAALNSMLEAYIQSVLAKSKPVRNFVVDWNPILTKCVYELVQTWVHFIYPEIDQQRGFLQGEFLLTKIGFFFSGLKARLLKRMLFVHVGNVILS